MPKRFRIDNPIQLTAYVRALRKARGRTQADIARELGVSTMRVATIEKDLGRVSTHGLITILHLLGAHLELEAPDLPEPGARPMKEGNGRVSTKGLRPRRGEW